MFAAQFCSMRLPTTRNSHFSQPQQHHRTFHCLTNYSQYQLQPSQPYHEQQHTQQRCQTTVNVRLQAQAGSGTAAPGGLFGDIMKGLMEMASQQKDDAIPPPELRVTDLMYHPAGSPAPLLQPANLVLPPRSLGVVFGRSGSGKTTLLVCLAGLVQQSAGSVGLQYGDKLMDDLNTSIRQRALGLVFQFPERHFLGSTIAQELTLSWPRGSPADTYGRQIVAANVLQSVGLSHIPLDTPLYKLSDGYKRRVALAVQLCRQPQVLLLDEPLAGLDWKARADVARLLGQLKQERSILIVSHDLREIAPHVDRAWQMQQGGILRPSDSLT